MRRQVIKEPLKVHRIVLAIRIQEEVEIKRVGLQVGDARAQGQALPAPLARFQPQHFGPGGDGHGASGIRGAIIHHQHAMESEGLQPL